MTDQFSFMIPKELSSPLFFPEQTFVWSETYNQKLSVKPILLYELAHYSNISAIKPWEDPIDNVPLIWQEWKQEKILLGEIFKKRNKSAKKETIMGMTNSAGLLLEYLYWTNGQPVRLDELSLINHLNVKPVNATERISFILDRPNSFPSFIQLSELFAEQEKQFEKAKALKKLKSSQS
ncbi:YpoC family protein [Mesobacillus harenae]|uniref:YpoC family protein n=1 Tax=Mesobacillus harenae TaxID=2213203 RepID=UPI001580EEC4|nr:hypothetical protein [Mesobacillus harenae]